MYQKETQRELYYKYEQNPDVPWTFTKNGHSEDGTKIWHVRAQFPKPEIAQHRHHLEQIADLLNEQEATIARLSQELSEVLKDCKSLREDLSSFSTFEQICNSGMLRNFKIDSESPFAQTILSLLQRTMELQISHLSDQIPDPERPPQ